MTETKFQMAEKEEEDEGFRGTEVSLRPEFMWICFASITHEIEINIGVYTF